MWHEVLKKLRENKEKTQQDIADFLNMSRTGYAHYEIGRSQPSIEQIIQLAQYFGVTIDYLLDVSNVNLKNKKELGRQIDQTINMLQEIKKVL